MFCATIPSWIQQGSLGYKCMILDCAPVCVEVHPKLGLALQVSPCFHLMHLIWCLDKRKAVTHHSVLKVSKGHVNVIRKYLLNLLELEVTI